MGVLGWDKIADNVTLVGQVTGHEYNGGLLDGDNDWSLFIQPTPVDAKTPPHPPTAPGTAPYKPPVDDRTRLEHLWQSDFGPITPETAPFSEALLEGDLGEDDPGCGDANDAIAGLDDEYLKALVWQCLSEGLTNEAEQIKQIWGIAKSGENPRYRKATKRLRALRRKFNL